MNNEKIRNEYYEIWFAVNAIYESWAKAGGLTANSLFTLYLIFSGEDTLGALCEKLSLPKQTVASILNAFEKNGYIKREASGKDKRSKIITFTPDGHIYAEKIINNLSAFEESAFGAMAENEKAQLILGNRALLKNLKKAANGGRK